VRSSLGQEEVSVRVSRRLIDDIAWQVVKEGHEVKLYIDNKEEREIGDGFVPKTDNWEADVAWADVIVLRTVLSTMSLGI